MYVQDSLGAIRWEDAEYALLEGEVSLGHVVVYRNDGHSFERISEEYELMAGEHFFSDIASPEDLGEAFPAYDAINASAAIMQQILDLEATITPRRLREAILDVEGGAAWLAAAEASIDALRDLL